MKSQASYKRAKDALSRKEQNNISGELLDQMRYAAQVMKDSIIDMFEKIRRNQLKVFSLGQSIVWVGATVREIINE